MSYNELHELHKFQRMVPSRLHELHGLKLSFVSRIEFIRSKLKIFPLMYPGTEARTSGVQ